MNDIHPWKWVSPHKSIDRFHATKLTDFLVLCYHSQQRKQLANEAVTLKAMAVRLQKLLCLYNTLVTICIIEIQTDLRLQKLNKQLHWLKIDHIGEIIQEICLRNLQRMKIENVIIPRHFVHFCCHKWIENIPEEKFSNSREKKFLLVSLTTFFVQYQRF